jgi:2-oxoglutarate/2-oxoacid ferredoxin oxidoreductase subunit beta
MGKVSVDHEKCKACMLCTAVCRQDLLKTGEHFNSSGYTPVNSVDDEECTGCGLCALMCPEAALEVSIQKNGTQKIVARRPEVLFDVATTYCPGCSHGIVHRLIAEIIDELGIQDQMIGVTSIGCSIFIYKNFNIDYCEGAHGRAPAVATGVKRVYPEKVVFTYQGDGDIAAIGTSEIIHAAARNENFTVIFVNNGNYGMTGGQMAPTTLLGEKTTSTPQGRKPSEGFPIKVCELLSTLEGSLYIARGAVNDPKNVRQTKKYIKKAFQYQMENKGFSMVEILGTCPSNWKKGPLESVAFLEQKMIPFFPLGEKRILEGDNND